MNRLNQLLADRRSERLVIASLLPLLAFIASPARGNAAFVFEPVAVMGEPAPGTEAGTVFGPTPTIYVPVVPNIDAQGRIAFAAMLTGPAVTSANGSALWVGEPGAVALVARAGSPAPGTAPGVTYFSFPVDFALGTPLVGTERLVFRATLTGPGIDETNTTGLWSHEAGTTELLVREGDPAPELGSAVHIQGLFAHRLSASDDVMIQATLAGIGITSTNDEGFWTDRTGSLALLFREGDPAPGTASGVVFGGAGEFIGTGYSFDAVLWNPVAQRAVDGSVTGTGVDTFNNEVLYVERDGQLHLLAREDDPAPGAGHHVNFGGNSILADFGMLSFNALGQTAFQARIGGGNISTTYTIFSDHTGTLTALLLPGTPAPGTNDNFGIAVGPVLSDGGRIAFRAALAGAPAYFPPFGIWWDQPGTPGTLSALVVPGVTTTDRPGLTIVNALRILGFNAAGQMVFEAALGDPQSPSNAIVSADPLGNVRVVVASGDVFDVRGDGSVYRQVSEVAFGGLNDAGQMSLRLDFTDGSFAFYRVSPAAPTDVVPGTEGLAQLARCAPNPFGAGTHLAFHVARPGRVEVSVFDVAGRVVARLLDEPRGVGGYSLAWDGRDATGSQVASGVYWAMIRTPTASTSVRLVRVMGR